MKKKNKERPDAILTGDIHLRETSPVCRTDNFFKTQEKKLQFIKNLQNENEQIPVLDSGDIFDSPKPSNYLVGWALEHLPSPFISVCGNHDIPNHDLKLLSKSGVNVLNKAKTGQTVISKLAYEDITFRCREDSSILIKVSGIPWEKKEKLDKKIKKDEKIKRVLLTHCPTYKKKVLWKGMKAIKADILLQKLHLFDLVVTGHIHLPYSLKTNKNVLVNPGSLTRTTIAQLEHTPRVYFWYAKSNRIKKVFLPIEKNVMDLEIIDDKEKEELLNQFMEEMTNKSQIGIDFEENVSHFLSKNKINKKTKSIVKEILWKVG